jgi:acyl carrier protein
MIPRDFVFLEKFPLNANGKVDRHQLRQMAPASETHQLQSTESASELEQKLLAIWKEVLELERVGIRDNFFDLGGHSLLAAHAVSRIRSELRLNITVRMLFAAPTVESLARAIETMRPLDEEDAEIANYLSELEGLAGSIADHS